MAIGPMKPDGGRYDSALARKAAPAAQMPAPSQPMYSQPTITPSNTGQYSRPAPPPVANQPGPVPDINAYLGADSGYQQQLAAIAKALTDFGADVTRRTGTVDSQFGESRRALDDQRLRDLKMIEDDFASRGLLQSGLYGTEVGDYESEFGKRVSDIARQRAEALALLTQEQGQFTSQQELAKQAAREAALQRRAAQLGV